MKAMLNGEVMKRKRSNAAKSPTGKTKPAKVEFRAKAADGSKVFLVGSFNDWDPKATPMKRNGDSVFKKAIDLPIGRHEYKFLINDTWHIDEQCPQWVQNAFGSLNSVIEIKQV
ncbi:MAG: isoamylase early set domain-containing protein [bacterium]